MSSELLLVGIAELRGPPGRQGRQTIRTPRLPELSIRMEILRQYNYKPREITNRFL